MKTLEQAYLDLGISNEVFAFGEQVLTDLADRFDEVDRIAEVNQLKVLAAMRKEQVSEAHLVGTSGYGYNDLGRDTLERVYGGIFHAEAALVRTQITSGTHAIAIGLYGNLRPGDTLLSISGKPYDTLEEVIGIRSSAGSLAEFGIHYREVDLLPDGSFDLPAIEKALEDTPRMIAIQRSKGYATRKSLSIKAIKEVIDFIRKINPEILIFVDNCYGEFVCTEEPTDVGADLIAGSLIKNPGGGLAPSGGYLCGTKAAILRAATRMTAPGLGAELGPSLNANRALYQGLFLAPTVVAAAVKSALFVSKVYEACGFAVHPASTEERTDIITAITLGTEEGLLAFCRGIQRAAAVDAHVTPEAAPMPGYQDPVVMAAGAFISGSSIELSADGPLVAPYTAYFQGGLTWPSAKLGILSSIEELRKSNLLVLPEGGVNGKTD